MKQTAVEWLVEQLTVVDNGCINKTYLHLNKTLAGRHLIELIERAKEMEKEQIIDTYDAGQLHFWPDEFLQRGEYYYNETFNTNEK